MKFGANRDRTERGAGAERKDGTEYDSWNGSAERGSAERGGVERDTIS